MAADNSLYIEPAGSGWTLLMQSGVMVDCLVDQSLETLLKEDFSLTDCDLTGIEALILDGSSVDDIKNTVVRDQSRLALAAGLPGVAGMALKKDSALKGLRNSITCRAEDIPEKSKPGRICLALYSLVLGRLGSRFLRNGIYVTPKQLLRYASFNLGDLVRVGGRVLPVKDFIKEVEKDPLDLYFLKALVSDKTEPVKSSKPSELPVTAGEQSVRKAASRSRPDEGQDPPAGPYSRKKTPSAASGRDKETDGCQNCPVGCQKPQKSGWRRHEAELASIWGIDPQEPSVPELAGEFKRLCNDLGLEAFELSGSLASALEGTQAPRTVQSVRRLFKELEDYTPLGRLMGMGRVKTAQTFGLDPSLQEAPQKKAPFLPEIIAFLDSLGFCQQAAGPLLSGGGALNPLADLLTARYGRTFNAPELNAMGADILTWEEEFILKAREADGN
ncbi:MAG: hypothetical protein LBP22_17630 [Deltaproteobacteria bacterium]|jgi:hypothetical protein|nr:hypothetical protein [Deltaproteobacteria bacterium]